jgi:UDP:flavonoid glycosyltransferase YjiC (YdhE family)
MLFRAKPNMSNVLFHGVPSHGHVNPTIGLVQELVARGESVTYFASSDFREKIERAGASFKAYEQDLDMFNAAGGYPKAVDEIFRFNGERGMS